MYCLEFAGEDDSFAALEAGTAATDVSVFAPGIGVGTALDPDRIRTLALTHRACDLIGHTDADVDAARAMLAAAPLSREGSIAVRARDVRSTAEVDTQRAERELGSVLVDRGYEVDLDDPDHVLRALFADGPIARDPAYDGADEGDSTTETGRDDPSTTTDRDDSSTDLGNLPDEPLLVDAQDEQLDPVGSGAVTVDDDAASGRCVLGWTVAESDRSFGERAPTDRPFFQPGSMDPLLARALANVAGARPGATVLDPMCGTGGVLLEAREAGARVIGLDAQRKMVEGTRTNLDATDGAAPDATDGAAPDVTDGAAPDAHVCRGDARRPPFPDGVADGIVFDAPYERQSAVAGGDLTDLVERALGAACELAPRAVVVADRPWIEAAREAGWTVRCVHRRRVHRSLVRHIHILDDEPS